MSSRCKKYKQSGVSTSGRVSPGQEGWLGVNNMWKQKWPQRKSIEHDIHPSTLRTPDKGRFLRLPRRARTIDPRMKRNPRNHQKQQRRRRRQRGQRGQRSHHHTSSPSTAAASQAWNGTTPGPLAWRRHTTHQWTISQRRGRPGPLTTRWQALRAC